MSQTPTLEEVIELALAESAEHMYTAMPGRIMAYDADLQSASVQPSVYANYVNEQGDTVHEPLPVVQGVPVVFPGGGEWSITFPIEAGMTGLLVFMNCSIDRWLVGDGRDTNPVDGRRHSLADAVFIPGLRPFGNPVAPAPAQDAMVLEGPDVRIGGYDGAEQAVLGNSLLVAMSELLSEIGLSLGAVAGFNAAQYGDAVTAFLNAVWLAERAKVK